MDDATTEGPDGPAEPTRGEEGAPEVGVLRDELEKKKVKELKEICRTNQFKGYSTLTKPQLIEHILVCTPSN